MLPEIVPCEKRLSVTVGIGELESGFRVPTVRATGPILVGERLVQYFTVAPTWKNVDSPEDTVDIRESSGLEEQLLTN